MSERITESVLLFPREEGYFNELTEERKNCNHNWEPIEVPMMEGARAIFGPNTKCEKCGLLTTGSITVSRTGWGLF